MTERQPRMVDRWFPVEAVNKAVGTAEGSGRSEKAFFTWFASRPIAQARAAVLTALLPDDEALRPLVAAAVVQGDKAALERLAALATVECLGRPPVVLDPFSGRGIISLEAARLGCTAVGLDYSPVATLAGRLLADFPLRDWTEEVPLPFKSDEMRAVLSTQPRLVSDVRTVLAEVGRRVTEAMAPHFPANQDGRRPWGYLWAVTIPCDACRRRFPLIGSFALRHPYHRTGDLGQAFRLLVEGDSWRVEIFDGVPDQIPPNATAAGKKGKSARCPFCQHNHPLATVKAKGFAGQYEDVPLLAAESLSATKKVFRVLRPEELDAATGITVTDLEQFGTLSAVPDEAIPPGNEDTVRASGHGYRRYGDLMNRRQTRHFVETVRAIRACHGEMTQAGLSAEYAAALSCYASANLVRRMRRSTRGAKLLSHGSRAGVKQNRVQTDHVFSDESKVAFQCDYFETGLGDGPGTWDSIAETGVAALQRHLRGLTGRPAKLRRGSAMGLPYRDGTVDVVVTDPPYSNMIDYLDASDLFYVWLKRVLFDVAPDLFARPDGVQDKADEIIVKRGNAPGEHRTREFYERSLSRAFAEARRVLRPEGTLVVVYGHSDPDAWKRLLRALYDAGFVVTSTWPSRTETADTGVASIKVTVSIGCRVAPPTRPTATAAQVDREVADAVKARARQWERDGLALTDQMMAAYGPAMEVYGRYSSILQPDGDVAPIERYLTLARAAARDAAALKVDEIPLETFDDLTRFAVFWMRLHGRGNVPKGEAVFLAQADGLRLDDVRDGLLDGSTAGYKLTLDAPAKVTGASKVFDVVRAMAQARRDGGSDEVAGVLAAAERSPDDEQVWAVIHELTRQLPPGDRDAMALAGIQRTAATIRRQVDDIATGKAKGQPQGQFSFAVDGPAEGLVDGPADREQ